MTPTANPSSTEDQQLLEDVLAYANGKADLDAIEAKEQLYAAPEPDRLRPMTSVVARPSDQSVVSEIAMQPNQSLFRGPLYPELQTVKDEEGTDALPPKDKDHDGTVSYEVAKRQQGAEAVARASDTERVLGKLYSHSSSGADPPTKSPPDEVEANSSSPPAIDVSTQPLPTGGNIRSRTASTPGAFPVTGIGGSAGSDANTIVSESSTIPPDIEHGSQFPPPPPEDHDGLVEAQAVTDEDEIHGEAEEMDCPRTKTKRRKEKEQRYIVLGVCLALVVVVGTVLGLVFGLAKDDNSGAPTALPTTAPSLAPTAAPSPAPSAAVETILGRLTNETIARLEDGNSPQYKAYEWLSDHESITTMPEWRKLQLFALGTFFYAFEGPHWPEDVQENWMSDEKNECYWFSNLFGDFSDTTGLWEEGNQFLFFNDTQCNPQGEFTSTTLNSLGLSEYSPYIPPEIALLTSLTSINLDFNDIHYTGPPAFIPSEIGQLKRLEFFRIWNNKIQGLIPSEFGLLTKMTILDFDGNLFHGSMPSELFQLSRLEELWFNKNQVTGSIPTQIGQMESLVLVELTGNDLSGTIPTQVGRLDNMTSMAFGRNGRLSGNIPSEIGQMAVLHEIWLTDTKISGRIPSEAGLVSNMEQLMLPGNFLTGPIPTQLGWVSKMRQLSLAHNFLTGTIPSELGLMENLVFLDLSKSFLSGPIPASALSELVSSYNLSFVNISGNAQLTGTIPEELCALNSHNGTCEYKRWNALAIHVNDMYPCALDFDCTDKLCGCDCNCDSDEVGASTASTITPSG